jgi:hypothetical protein
MGTGLWSPVVALVALSVACASPPAPVPVVADTADLLQLAGEWEGYYSSPAAERQGNITFALEAGRDTAYGDVLMVPRGWSRPLGLAEDPAAAARDAPIPATLRIRFVRVEDGRVSGTLEPYRDPDCGCAVYTTFVGMLRGDVVEGTFTSRLAAGPLYKGTWLVERKRD